MKMRLLRFPCLLIWMTSLSLQVMAAQPDALSGEMVMPGSWHGEEVVARDGEPWLALITAEHGSVLEKVTVRVEMVEDAILDTPPAKTGKKVSVTNNHEPLFLLRNLPQLTVGPVKDAEIVETNFRIGQAQGIYFNGMTYELQVQCADDLRGQELADCPLLLSVAGSSQELSRYPVYRPANADASLASEAIPQVLWAGDLDRDGRLDLLIDLTDHYNVSAPTLLLSGSAKGQEMVMPVAVFRTTGC